MKIRVASTEHDLEFIQNTWLNPSILPHINDDMTMGEMIRWDKVVAHGLFLIPIVDDGGRIGFFYLVPQSNTYWEVHVAILPQYRGKVAIEAGKAVVKWFFENTPAKKLVANVPVDNQKAYALARRVGFNLEGMNRKSFLRNHKLIDQYFMGICKEEVICLQKQ